MTMDPKMAKVKVLEALRASAMDGYRLMQFAGLSRDELQAAIDGLGSVVRVDGGYNKDIGERYFSILPSDLGRAEQTISILSSSA